MYNFSLRTIKHSSLRPVFQELHSRRAHKLMYTASSCKMFVMLVSRQTESEYTNKSS